MKSAWHAHLTLAVCATLAVGCSAPAQERKYRLFFSRIGAELVPDYRLPPESAYGPLWAAVEGTAWQSRDGSGRTKAEFWTSGDFNGDAALDYAYILIHASSNERALHAFLSSPEGHEAVLVQQSVAPRMGLATREPGRYAAVAEQDASAGPGSRAGAGSDAQAGAEPDAQAGAEPDAQASAEPDAETGADTASQAAGEELDMRNEGIVFFHYDGGSSTFVWNETAGRFDRYTIGD